MKKLMIIICLIASAGIISGQSALGKGGKTNTAMIYYVDSSLYRLVGMECPLSSSSLSLQAKEMTEKLIDGMDYNPHVIRVFPKKKGCIKAKVRKNTAYIDLGEDMINALSGDKSKEQLMIYSIVNSVTSIKGIDTVRFLIGGKEKDMIIGDIDMRETFIPDYSI